MQKFDCVGGNLVKSRILGLCCDVTGAIKKERSFDVKEFQKFQKSVFLICLLNIKRAFIKTSRRLLNSFVMVAYDSTFLSVIYFVWGLYGSRFAWDGMMLVPMTRTLKSGRKEVEQMEV